MEQAQSCSRRKGEAGSAKTAWKGLIKAMEAGPGKTGSEQLGLARQLGLGRAPRKQGSRDKEGLGFRV